MPNLLDLLKQFLPKSEYVFEKRDPRQQLRESIARGFISPVNPDASRPTPTPTPTPTPLPSPKASPLPQQYSQQVTSAAKEQDIPLEILINLLSTESNFNPNAASPAGAMGIAQFMPQTVNELQRLGYGNIDPLDPSQAIPAAAFYLNYLQGQLGSLPAGIAAYNAGIGRVGGLLDEYGSLQDAYPYLPQETQQYLYKVLGVEPDLLSQYLE